MTCCKPAKPVSKTQAHLQAKARRILSTARMPDAITKPPYFFISASRYTLQCCHVSRLNGGNTAFDFFFVQIQPAQGFRIPDHCIFKAAADRFCMDAANDGIGLYVLGYHGTRTDNRTVADFVPCSEQLPRQLQLFLLRECGFKLFKGFWILLADKIPLRVLVGA